MNRFLSVCHDLQPQLSVFINTGKNSIIVVITLGRSL